MTEKEWKLEIIRASNGFILRHWEEIDTDRYRAEDIVVEESESEENDCDAIQTMLYHVLEFFGVSGSKHDKRRIRIVIEDQERDT